MTRVEEEGFTNLKVWRSHWDRQLYKALEHQYQVEIVLNFCPERPDIYTYVTGFEDYSNTYEILHTAKSMFTGVCY
jgi:hypothetical protein